MYGFVLASNAAVRQKLAEQSPQALNLDAQIHLSGVPETL